MIIYQPLHSTDTPSIHTLLDEAECEGFKFLRRLVDEWQSGDNRFDSAGEVFLICRENDKTIALGGLNIDPYTDDPNIGRIRHMYVARDHRRRGIGQHSSND